MRIAKRVFLFIAINFLVVLTLSLVLSLLGIKPYLTSFGLDMKSLIFFCLIWGIGGAFISLSLSRLVAKWLMKVKIIDPKSAHATEKKLVQMVEKLTRHANLSHVPQLGIFQSHSMNAFATGPTKKRSLIAVSTTLVQNMDEREIEAVLAHEMSHIANGDMVTMTLIQGIVNAFVMFLARILAFALSSVGRGNEKRTSYMSFYLLTFLFEFIFMIFGSVAIAFFSRLREFRADRGAAMLSSKENMIAALTRLQQEAPSEKKFLNRKEQNAAFNAMMISMPRKVGLLRLFATHPPLEERIAHLKESI